MKYSIEKEERAMEEISFRLATIADLDLLVNFMQQFYALDHYPFDPFIFSQSGNARMT